MQLESWTQAELEHATGIDRTTISRFQRGERIPSREQLGALLAGISGDRTRRLQLFLAHLRDEATAGLRAGLTPSHYVLAAVDDDVPPQVAGPLAAELELLRDEALQTPEVRTMIEDLAALILRHRAALADKVAPFPGPVAAVAEDAAPYGSSPGAPLPPVPRPGETG